MVGRHLQRVRSRHVGVAALLAVALVGFTGCAQRLSTSPGSPSGSPSISPTPSRSVSPTPAPTPASWRRLAGSPLHDYWPPAAAVWDGREMLVVVTHSDPKANCAETLYAYNPSEDVWRMVSRVPTREGCFEGVERAVWTGEELLLWGISNAAYKPETDRWRKLPKPPAGAGGPSVVVWTGRQMIGWGGGCCDQEFADGAAYAPATNSWRMLPPSPLAGRHAAGVWTGREMIIAGGEGYEQSPGDPSSTPKSVHFADAAAYNPTTRTWRKLPAMPVRRGGGYYTVTYSAVWDGTEMLVLGGTRSGRAEPIARGVAYDPSTNKWRWLAPMEFPRTWFVSSWTGDQLIVWGGIGAGGSIPSHGETYDPVKNVWSALPKAPLRARVDAVAVWSGAQMLIWGGSDARGVTKPIATFSALSDGAALTPASA